MATRKKAVMAGARTVIYVHGIGNKPPESVLRGQWDKALFRFEQGERTRMAYWVDRERYPEPEGGEIHPAGFAVAGSGVDWQATPSGDDDGGLESLAREADDPKAALRGLGEIGEQLRGSAVRGRPGYSAKGVLDPLTKSFTRMFLRDVNDFLFVAARRERMIETVLERVATGGGPFVVIGHSQGTMIAYEALLRLAGDVEVPLFVTLGSPLGLAAVTGQLRKWHGGLRVPRGVGRWLNVAADGDIVCADRHLANDFRGSGAVVEDVRLKGWLPPLAAHDSLRYLGFEATRNAVFSAVDRGRFQRVGEFTVTRDLVRAMDERAERRHPVLVELVDRPAGRGKLAAEPLLDRARAVVTEWIEGQVLADGVSADEIGLEVLDHYVAADLTRREVECLAAALSRGPGTRQAAVYRVFRNHRKRALLRDSCQTIQALPAQRGYGARGQGVTWAVLDSGIDAGHPHFKVHGNLLASHDCTRRGPVVAGGDTDPCGHGTHVAGILAGEMADLGLVATAPECKLVTYRVLASDGSGHDAWIIKAIDHIHALNARSGGLAIHGLNLSVGGPFDAASFGCGDSPVCASLRRLVRQGVIVVIAAGNEGVGEVTVDGHPATVSFDLSIGDPANLEEGIAVGSVHPVLPHLYGTSYFSSRGPTADGRVKPDVVAPGERIWSCRAGGRGRSLERLYVESSGTSMAAPHVSGLLAAFLSVRREFIGQPGHVKEILLAHCTDLARDRYHQGAGLPNLTKMLLNT